MSEKEIESEIQEKGLTAPRITPDRVDNVIAGETYTVLPSGKVMVCELTLVNGFTVRGEAATVSKENFNGKIGRRISRENARDKVREVEGYLLQQKLHEEVEFKAKSHQQQVLDDKAKLDKKVRALAISIGHSRTFRNLDPAEKERLREQFSAMRRYSDTLGARIAAFDEET